MVTHLGATERHLPYRITILLAIPKMTYIVSGGM